jgi:hypothetical protein
MISSRNDYRWSKSINRGQSNVPNQPCSINCGGDSMNDSKGIRQRKVTAFMAMLLGAIFTILILPAYGQQEGDPTWYDPWAPSTTVVHSIQTAPAVQAAQVATHRDQQPAQSVSSAAGARKFRARDSQLNQSHHSAAQKKDSETLSADGQAQ